MRQNSHMQESSPDLSSAELLGEGQQPDKLQGHWVLARAGKKVLRPGGIALSRRMIDALAIGQQDRVVEFAPGLGVTARLVLERRPLCYCGVEREPAAAERLRRLLSGATVQVVQGAAEDSWLPDACATVVYSEALLSMQSPQQKSRIIAEACRLLSPGGQYAIQELCLLPDNIPGGIRQKIQAAMSREIHVGVQPLCRSEWIGLFQQHGLKITWSGEAPMHLLEPHRLLRDEGLMGSARIAFHIAANSGLRRRILAMRRLFHEYEAHLGAISMIGRLES